MPLSEPMQIMVDRHEKTIKDTKERIEMMERGELEIFEITPGGGRRSLKDQTIESDRHTIDQLQKIVDAAKASDGDRDKFMELLIS